MNRVALKAQLTRHEGRRRSAYQDSLGYWTIGVGRCVDARLGCGLKPNEIDFMLDNDIDERYVALSKALPWFVDLDDMRQNVLINMSFMGVGKLLKFERTLEFVRTKQWTQAAAAMLDSKWAKQVGARAVELANIMRTGIASE